MGFFVLVSVAHVDSLVNDEPAFDVAPLPGANQFAMAERNRVERRFDFRLPELDKPKKFWEVRCQVVFLSDEFVNDRTVIRHAIEQSSNRETVPAQHQFGFRWVSPFVRVLLGWQKHSRPPVR